ncbi:MAG: PorT family protein [Bacteroidetes bacterium]|nr:PorT family protein [Bacteroidota bacterium]
MKKKKIVDSFNDHINQLIKEKLDSFEPTPPPQVWQGVLSDLDARQKAAQRKAVFKYLAAVLLVLLFSTFAWYYFTGSTNTKISNSVYPADLLSSDETPDILLKDTQPQPSIEEKTIQLANQPEEQSEVLNGDFSVDYDELPAEVATETLSFPAMENLEADETMPAVSLVYPGLKFHQSGLTFRPFTWYNPVTVSLIPRKEMTPQYPVKDNSSVEKRKKSYQWTTFAGFSAELALTSFDSVTVLNSYALHFEPTIYLTKNWFLRSGIGVSYAHDRGFARLDYISNDYMGSYNDVYNVTFDSINGQVVPTYHTKTVEVWDSVRHLVISEVTNRYVYLQIPLLAGYYHKAKNSNLNWYVFGGPAVNFQVARVVEEPNPAGQYIEIIDLQNKLPERNSLYFQLWLGAGVEYKVNDRFSVAIEPGYRYYINSLYNKDGYQKPISAFSVRIGAVMRLK